MRASGPGSASWWMIDRAIGAVITMAIPGQIAQRIGHFLKLAHFCFQFLDMAERHLLHIGGSAVAVAPERQQFLDLLHLKTEVAAAANEAQRLDILLRIDAIAGTGSVGGFNKSDGFIMADRSSLPICPMRLLPGRYSSLASLACCLAPYRELGNLFKGPVRKAGQGGWSARQVRPFDLFASSDSAPPPERRRR